jgi:hypothetical protein
MLSSRACVTVRSEGHTGRSSNDFITVRYNDDGPEERRAQVHETNFPDEIPDGISSEAWVRYRHGCQGTVRSELVTLCHQMAGGRAAHVAYRGGHDGPDGLKGVTRP